MMACNDMHSHHAVHEAIGVPFLSSSIPDLCHSQELFAGPYRFVFREMAQCEESGTRQIYSTSTRISKFELDTAIFGNGGWRPHFMMLEVPQFCTSLKESYPEAYNAAVVHTFHTECPFPPGTYEIKELDLGRVKISSMPKLVYGKYRVDLLANINGTLIGCFRCYLDTVPARRERPQKNKKNNESC